MRKMKKKKIKFEGQKRKIKGYWECVICKKVFPDLQKAYATAKFESKDEQFSCFCCENCFLAEMYPSQR
ncbi:hypothetical protein DRQ25_04665 [Candidatus Fermentibacteria bacterium]|nr:MAG: hypothetical protein DRQ25_04665 [Candidatus Fermentibacteria bacterium]